MNKVHYSDEYINKTKAVAGCFSMFLLMVAITFIPALLSNRIDLMNRGLLFPLLYGMEFIIIVPLYYLFFRNKEGLGKGHFFPKAFFILLGTILLLQFVAPYLLGIRKAESWTIEQVSLNHYAFWLGNLPLIFIVPIYEEIIFRGCLFNTFEYWFNENIYGSAVAVSVLFSLLHTQYSDVRSLFILFLVSLTLVAARVKSKGLLMPIVLHMMMNGIVIGTQYLIYTF